MATPRKGSDSSEDKGSEEADGAVTRSELKALEDKFLSALDELGSRSKPSRGNSSRPADRTDKEVEADAHESTRSAFDRLLKEREHDEHHRKLVEAQKAAEERREKAEKKSPPPPTERKGLASAIWDY